MKAIPGHQGYFATVDGEIYSSKTNRLLTQQTHKRYNQLTLTIDGKSKTFAVHRLILLAFVGECPDGLVACHNDGNARNNRLENLRWDTQTNNVLDTLNQGKHNCAKLTEQDVKTIRELLATKCYRQREIAVVFGVSTTQISQINTGKEWKHIV